MYVLPILLAILFYYCYSEEKLKAVTEEIQNLSEKSSPEVSFHRDVPYY